MMVEGKKSDLFDTTIAESKAEQPINVKETRLNYLRALLKLSTNRMDHLLYQLLHRTASALIEAKIFSAPGVLYACALL